MAGNKNSGRKPKPKNERGTACISSWLPKPDKALIEQAAKAERVPTGRWLGNLGVKKAKEVLQAKGLPKE